MQPHGIIGLIESHFRARLQAILPRHFRRQNQSSLFVDFGKGGLFGWNHTFFPDCTTASILSSSSGRRVALIR